MKGVQDVKAKFTSCVFTLNNYTDADYDDLLNNDLFSYIIIGKEVGDEGTPHLQGYFELKKQSRFNKVKLINTKMFFERRKGSQEQAIAYCKKDGVYEENGVRKVQGDRTDLSKLKACLSDGQSIGSIIKNNDLTYQQLKFCQVAQPYLLKQDFVRKKVIWCYGPTGTGKSEFAWNYAPMDQIYCKEADDHWWDGYDGQPVVIIDELRACNFKFSKLLRLFDKYPCRVQIKGSSRLLTSETIIVTTNKHPRDMFVNKTDEDIQQLLRRIELKEFGVQEVCPGSMGNIGTILPSHDLDDMFKH